MFWIGNALRLVRREPIRILSVLQRQRFEGCEPIRQKFTLNPTIHFTRTFSLVADECWSCKQVLMETGSPFCPGCNVLQRPPNDLNYFEIMGIAPEYDLKPTDLTQHFRKLQTLLHPDKFTTKSQEEKVNSDEWSALVNRAYKTLLVPLTRAEYLLQLNGMTIPEDNSAVDAEFLMEMMEKNEEIEEAEDEEMLLEILKKNQLEIKGLIPSLEEAFATGYLDQAVRTLIRMRYLYSIENSIKTKGQRLGFGLSEN